MRSKCEISFYPCNILIADNDVKIALTFEETPQLKLFQI